MRVFIVLTALCACVLGAPQYGYEQQSGNPGHSGGNAASGNNKYLPPNGANQEPIIRKQFYLISAPDDGSNDAKNKHLVLGRPQKNYRVVFIKAPDSGNGNVKYSAEFAPQEEKTVIYVLSKKDDELGANDIATPEPTQPSKPEVFFIKYKTDDEADQAQKEIQGQYDKLGGTSEISDEGTAPITSVIGALDSLNPDGSYNYRQVNGAGGNGGGGSRGSANLSEPSQQYLPSFFKS